jgi:peptide/nickel transport system substrate-binding protein
MRDGHDLRPIQSVAAAATRRQFLVRAGGVAAALALPGGVLAACGSDESGSSDFAHLQWGLPGGVDAISYNDFSIVAPYLVQLGLEGLLQVDYKGEIVPWLADKYENKGNQEFVLSVRDGVKWSDGSPFGIDDVMFQFAYNQEEKAQLSYGFYEELEVDKIEQTGPREVTVRTKRPSPRIPAAFFASQGAWFVKPSQLEDVGYERLGSPGALPIGTGPYVFDEFVPDSTLTVSRNKNYWADDRIGEVPDKVTVHLIKEDSARVLAARSGQISGALYLGPDQLDQYKSISGWKTYSVPELGIWFFPMNNKQAPFDDVHFRRAVSYALDREGVVAAVWGGKAQPATTLVPPQTWEGFLSKEELAELEQRIPTYEFNLDKAKQELAQSKYPDGYKITLLTTQGQPQQAQIAQIFAQDLRKVGITLEVKEVAETQWSEPLYGNDVDDPKNVIHINNYGAESRDPAVNLNALLWSENAAPQRANTSNFTNARVDELLERQAGITDPKQRAKALTEIIEIAAEEAAYIPIVWPDIGSAAGPGIEYEHPNPYLLNGGAFPVGLKRT